MVSASFKQKIKSNLPAPLVKSAATLLRFTEKKLPDHEAYESCVKGKKGIEIGGPSRLFKTKLAVYQQAGDLDNINFSRNTVWEGVLRPGRNFNYIGKKMGLQFICEATDLSQIESNSYDFLLSSNCLEHVANPLKALLEWKRVIRPGGALILVLPNKVHNFDHNRPFTSFAHLLEDFRNETTEEDMTHLPEILALHDLSLDRPAGTPEQFKKRSLDNFTNRALHHHVFNLELVNRMLTFAGFEVIETSETNADFYALAVKQS